ncbi:MAG: VOC family protein, partial [Nitrospinaceae bacterium]
MGTPSALGIKRIHSVEFVVDFFDRSRDFYIEKMGFAESHRSTPQWESEFRSKALVYSANDIHILVTAPLSTHSYTAQYLKLLCPGIRNVTYEVHDLAEAIDYL